MASNPTVASYAEAIKANWRRSVDGIICAAHKCAQAGVKLDERQKKTLLRMLPFKEATFSKLVKIGKHPRFKTKEIRDLLPPNYTIMYDIALLTPEQFDIALQRGLICPTVNRSDLELFRKGQNGLFDEDDPPKDEKIATIYVSGNYGTSKKAKLKAELEVLKGRFRCEVRWRVDPLERAETIHSRKYNRFVAQEGRRVVREILGLPQYKGKGKPAADYIEIAADADPDRVSEVLEYLGAEDQLDAILKRALHLIDLEPLEAKFGKHRPPSKEERAADSEEAQETLKTWRSSRGRHKKVDPKQFDGWT